ncbi:MAG: amidohydrolase, partial [Gemmatimonadetes bacterium]|nr:amidohydrolase [Gemmatimonadota bacterium]
DGAVYGLALRGARSAVLAVGPKGASVSADEGAHWRAVDEGNWWSVAFASDTVAFMVGPRGQLARVRLSRVRGEAGAAGAATLLLLNGRVLTVDDADRVAQAVAIRGNRIVGVGTDAEMLKLAAPGARRIDLHGRTVTPGLIDAHVHFARGGVEQIVNVALSYPGVKSIKDVVAAVAARARTTPAGRWVQGSGWDEGKLDERRYVTAKDLDAATTTHPVFLEHTTGHYAAVNSRALALAGITRDTKDPPGGTIDRDANGEPTGVLKESAQGLVERLIPRTSAKDLERGIAQIAKQFNAEGMTAAKDPGIDDETWAAYEKVARAGQLPVRVFALWSGGTSMADAERLIAKHAAMTRPYEQAGASPLVAGGVKLFMDGSGGARTAWVYDEWYKNGAIEPGNRGYPASNADTLAAMIRRYHDAGMHVSVHSIGDRAIDATLAAFRAALAANPVRGLRHGIIHAVLPTDSAIALMATLERTMDAGYPEPSANFGWWIGDLYGSTFGPARMPRMNPFASFQAQGIRWANGSDYFVTPFAARYGIWSAIARETLLGKYGPTPFGTAQAVDVHAALRAVTIWAARQLFLEQEVGSIEVGKRADLAVWDRDFYATPTADIKDARCLLTLFDGREVFRAREAPFR